MGHHDAGSTHYINAATMTVEPNGATDGADIRNGSGRAPAGQTEAASTGSPTGAAAEASPLITAMLGGKLTIRFDFWDGSSVGPAEPVGVIHVRSANLLRRLIWSPNELGVACH